ncbi:hypothetical protein ANCDUO_09621 [Ancylostoma duodenale]|uniref:Uncharacterized protein n=1 Tax=Ancylostoma duodenale TaxID=51022 RepID=A0A0C2GG73_9BILA|nr:hypothetical protein ANCDUO_09621 [Ancylostoma duodenale]
MVSLAPFDYEKAFDNEPMSYCQHWSIKDWMRHSKFSINGDNQSTFNELSNILHESVGVLQGILDCTFLANTMIW